MAATDPDQTNSPEESRFWSVWGIPLALGALTGFFVIAASASALTDQFGGLLGTIAFCLIGFFVALVTIAGCRAVSIFFFGRK